MNEAYVFTFSPYVLSLVHKFIMNKYEQNL